MKIFKICLLIGLWTYSFPSCAVDKPVTTDSRIRTFVYNKNEVFRVVVHFNYQTSIEFGEGEEIRNISSGNNYAWQLSPLGNTLFIKPLEESILTNMTVITNKRTYYFEIQSKPYSPEVDSELTYVVRFYIPSTEEGTSSDVKNVKIANVSNSLELKTYNFNYKVSGSKNLSPLKVFDNGINTFLRYDEKAYLNIDVIKVVSGTTTLKNKTKIIGNYLVIQGVWKMLEITQGKDVLAIHNINQVAN